MHTACHRDRPWDALQLAPPRSRPRAHSHGVCPGCLSGLQDAPFHVSKNERPASARRFEDAAHDGEGCGLSDPALKRQGALV